jgi:hypothetical protein
MVSYLHHCQDKERRSSLHFTWRLLPIDDGRDSYRVDLLDHNPGVERRFRRRARSGREEPEGDGKHDFDSSNYECVLPTVKAVNNAGF